ncbi:hypothetical protein LPJ53_000566 [Coemansia erecta]|uniref:Xylulose kinase n=1 Tax=Coemansia erecta TaxID=147472 RepID=A0A9W7Y7J3_9FUNG|nr:hypothetical protein LPJ53_000566 [Coemansia erecta]
MDQNISLFLGLDLSTQQLKGVIIDCQHNIVAETSVKFDSELPLYKTENGRHICGNTVTAPVHMWAEAVDLLMERISSMGYSRRICGIGGAAQQHGSVYWAKQGVEALSKLSSKASLNEQLEAAFSLDDSPIWEDSSTSQQCRQLEAQAGGSAGLAALTGSAAFERFTGAQIAKIKQDNQEVWQRTERISLVSSFVGSLLTGKIAPIDLADASGTNLLDIQHGHWHKQLCDSIDSQLVEMLGPSLCLANETIGSLSPYYQEKYGFSSCPIVAFTGDNPAAYAGFESIGGCECAPAIVSLGTSDTLLLPLADYPYGESARALETPDGHVLRHPVDPARYLAMLCYKNGSLARECVRDTLVPGGSSWEEFDRVARRGGRLAPRAFGFYYPMAEIQPRAQGIFHFEQSHDGDILVPSSNRRYRKVAEFSPGISDARAIVESQFMSMYVDCRRKTNSGGSGNSSSSSLKAVAVTGGASGNEFLQQVMANVLGADVYVVAGAREQALSMPAYGGAVSAAKAVLGAQHAGLEKCRYALQLVCSPDGAEHDAYLEALRDFEYLRGRVEEDGRV